MRIHVLCVGRARSGPEMALFEAYIRRVPWPVSLREVEEKRPLSAPERRAREALLLRKALPPGTTLVALDEHGRMLGSADFAARLGRWADAGVADLAFLIGGADGLEPALRDQAALVLSLSAMTWPHLLVRALLAEQLYRAHSILTGHPYHRA